MALLKITLKFCVLSVFTLTLNPGAISRHPALVSAHYQQSPNSTLLYQAVNVNNPQALLHYYYQQQQQWSPTQKNTWLAHPALKGRAITDHLQGLIRYQSAQPESALMWFKSAWHKGYLPAGVFYSRLLIAQQGLPAALKVLWTSELRHDDEAQLLLAQVLLQSNQTDKAHQLLSQLTQEQVLGAAELLANVDKLLNLPLSLDRVKPQTQACLLKLQPVVASYRDLNYTAQMIEQWYEDTQVQSMPVCFNQPLMFTPDKARCNHQSDKKQSCDLALLAEQLLLPDDVTPLIIFGDSGIANYANGIIYLNHHKRYGVFKHELFHHFGFIDEYPLTQSAGQRVCQGNTAGFVGENLFIVPTEQVAKVNWQQIRQQWQVKYSGGVKAVKAVASCNNFAYTAYAPTAQMTLMAFMDQTLPAAYVQRATDKLQTEPFDFANYQYAYALAFDDQGDRLAYLYWLEQSAGQGYRVAGELLGRELGW
ncbi:MAG: hypothetical protein ACI9FJ_003182 [Alteromonadaceae bacterium]